MNLLDDHMNAFEFTSLQTAPLEKDFACLVSQCQLLSFVISLCRCVPPTALVVVCHRS